MKLPSAIAASVLLALVILMGYIGFDISRQLTLAVHLALGLALLLDVAALYFAAAGRRRAAQACWAGVVLLLVGLQAWDQARLDQERKENAARVPGENENLLARAEARAACGNGDIATLQRSRMMDGTVAMHIDIVPADRNKRSETIAFSNGRGGPESDRGIRYYRNQSGTDCRSADYPSLDAMLARVQAHYEAQRSR
jgi:hypothetical protein